MKESITTYIHDIDCISCSDGELYISYEDKVIVFNTSNLYKELHILIDMVCNENDKEQDTIKQLIKESCKNI